jgi:Flp pilus assembly protein TadB
MYTNDTTSLATVHRTPDFGNTRTYICVTYSNGSTIMRSQTSRVHVHIEFLFKVLFVSYYIVLLCCGYAFLLGEFTCATSTVCFAGTGNVQRFVHEFPNAHVTVAYNIVSGIGLTAAVTLPHNSDGLERTFSCQVRTRDSTTIIRTAVVKLHTAVQQRGIILIINRTRDVSSSS